MRSIVGFLFCHNTYVLHVKIKSVLGFRLGSVITATVGVTRVIGQIVV